MPKNPPADLADKIQPFHLNGLDGRVLRAPATKKIKSSKEILLLYGHHALIERWFGLVENLTDYGNVTLPDLPGFGGMTSFGKIGQSARIDDYADYLAAFIKWRYKRKKFIIVGISFGFVVATRMLQKYPEIAGRVKLVVSMVGFMHEDDFHFTPQRRRFLRVASRIVATRPMALFVRYVCLNGPFLRQMYARLPASKRRFADAEPMEYENMLKFEVVLWHANDVRTHWLTTSEFLGLDNCRVPVALPVFHIASRHDHYFDNEMVKQHMLVTYNDYDVAFMEISAHTPSVLADKTGMAVMVPPALKRALNAAK